MALILEQIPIQFMVFTLCVFAALREIVLMYAFNSSGICSSCEKLLMCQ